MFLVPDTLDVKRKFTVNGRVYQPGEQITAGELAHVRSADVLLSRRFVVPTPDPHMRRTKPEHPTPTSMPATFRQKAVNEPVGPPDPTSVTVAPATASVVEGATTSLTATVLPAEAQQGVTWSSSNPAVATVDAGGVVTGVATGTATITATSAVPTVTGSSTVTVTAAGPPPATGVLVTPPTGTAPIAGTVQLSAAVQPAGSDQSVSWSSADSLIATVDTAGLVTGVAEGTVDVSAAATSNPSITGSSSVTITVATRETTRKPIATHVRHRKE